MTHRPDNDVVKITASPVIQIIKFVREQSVVAPTVQPIIVVLLQTVRSPYRRTNQEADQVISISENLRYA